MDRKPEYKEHPAYGAAVFHRVHGGGGKLFGSPLARHDTTVRLTISRSSVKHDLGSDWYYPTQELVEVEFSPAQFAELLTNMNVGSGVPCTIRFVQGDPAPKMPDDEPVEHEKVEAAFKENIKGTVGKLRQGLTDMKEVLAKKTLTKEDKRQIEWLVARALQEVESDAPFMVRQFGEAVEKVVVAAQAEVAASTQAVVERLGFQKLSEMKQALGTRPAPAPLELPSAAEMPVHYWDTEGTGHMMCGTHCAGTEANERTEDWNEVTCAACVRGRSHVLKR